MSQQQQQQQQHLHQTTLVSTNTPLRLRIPNLAVAASPHDGLGLAHTHSHNHTTTTLPPSRHRSNGVARRSLYCTKNLFIRHNTNAHREPANPLSQLPASLPNSFTNSSILDSRATGSSHEPDALESA